MFEVASGSASALHQLEQRGLQCEGLFGRESGGELPVVDGLRIGSDFGESKVDGQSVRFVLV